MERRRVQSARLTAEMESERRMEERQRGVAVAVVGVHRQRVSSTTRSATTWRNPRFNLLKRILHPPLA
jgi:hypothetical protein